MIMSTKEICKRGLSMTISLTLGNTRLPARYRLIGDAENVRQFFLRNIPFFSQMFYGVADIKPHDFHSSAVIESSALSI